MSSTGPATTATVGSPSSAPVASGSSVGLADGGTAGVDHTGPPSAPPVPATILPPTADQQAAATTAGTTGTTVASASTGPTAVGTASTAPEPTTPVDDPTTSPTAVAGGSGGDGRTTPAGTTPGTTATTTAGAATVTPDAVATAPNPAGGRPDHGARGESSPPQGDETTAAAPASAATTTRAASSKRDERSSSEHDGTPSPVAGAPGPAAAPAETRLTAVPAGVRSEAIARALDAALRSDRPNTTTTRLAVELDDATRVSVRLSGESVRVNVLDDPNHRLGAGWHRDVAEGMRRHGLEYDGREADAQSSNGQRHDDEPEPTTARDGGSRTRRRFSLDLPVPSP